MPRTHRRLAVLTAALALACAPAAPAYADPGEAFDRLVQDGLIENTLAQALAGIDIDAVLRDATLAAQTAAATGQPDAPEPASLVHARAQLQRNMSVAAPKLASALFGALGPMLRDIRADIANDRDDDDVLARIPGTRGALNMR